MTPGDDPGWASYAEAILLVHADPPFEVDLSVALGETARAAFAAAGLTGTFGLVTPENPYGREASASENADRLTRFLAELRGHGHDAIGVDGLSRDRQRVEHGVALALPQEVIIALAIRWQQSAIYWWDGEAMWVIGALTAADPRRLPLS
jgi:hypothetical protein